MGWSPLVHTGFLVSHATLDPVCPICLSRTGLSPSLAGLSRTVLLGFLVRLTVRTPWCSHHGLGSSAFDRLYLRNHFCFLFLRLLRCFSSPGSPPYTMDSCTDTCSSACAFPHSDIHGSLDMCSSPWLFAAYHVFLRLSVPGHPPRALSCLTCLCFLRLGKCPTASELCSRADAKSSLVLHPDDSVRQDVFLSIFY